MQQQDQQQQQLQLPADILRALNLPLAAAAVNDEAATARARGSKYPSIVRRSNATANAVELGDTSDQDGGHNCLGVNVKSTLSEQSATSTNVKSTLSEQTATSTNVKSTLNEQTATSTNVKSTLSEQTATSTATAAQQRRRKLPQWLRKNLCVQWANSTQPQAGPIHLLQRCASSGQRVLIYTRAMSQVDAVLRGTVASYDQHLNMVLLDVEETRLSVDSACRRDLTRRQRRNTRRGVNRRRRHDAEEGEVEAKEAEEGVGAQECVGVATWREAACEAAVVTKRLSHILLRGSNVVLLACDFGPAISAP